MSKKLIISVPSSKLSNFCAMNRHVEQKQCFLDTYKKNFHGDYIKILKKIKHEDKNQQNKDIIKKLNFEKDIKNVIETGKNRTKLLKSIEFKMNEEYKNIPENKRKILIQNVKKQADFKIKTQIGTKKENVCLDKFENLKNIKITSRNDELFTDTIESENVILNIKGKIDGINDEEKILVEHKYRINRLFETIPMYERFQITLYLKYTSMENCMLIQTYKDEQSILTMKWSDEEYERIHKKIIENLEKFYSIVSNPKKLENLVKKYSSPIVKNEIPTKNIMSFFN